MYIGAAAPPGNRLPETLADNDQSIVHWLIDRRALTTIVVSGRCNAVKRIGWRCRTVLGARRADRSVVACWWWARACHTVRGRRESRCVMIVTQDRPSRWTRRHGRWVGGHRDGQPIYRPLAVVICYRCWPSDRRLWSTDDDGTRTGWIAQCRTADNCRSLDSVSTAGCVQNPVMTLN